MSKGFEPLKNTEYPGRIIILGQAKEGDSIIAVYAITGRSASSQARKLDHTKDTIWVKPTHRNVLQREDVDLLIYPSLFFLTQGVAISNGKQTVDIMACLGQSKSAAEILAFALKNWDYEPDEPSFTPRISGCVLPNTNSALSLIRRAPDGSSLRNVYEFSIAPGKGKMIMTYRGENIDPLPSFHGEPLDVEINDQSAEDVAQSVYGALGKTKEKKDFRVALVCLFCRDFPSGKFDIHIINRFEKDTDKNG
jgi:IMP cyclohydrolase